jgi:hypothetical protein
MAELVRDILRQRRFKTNIILTARPAPLLTILKQILVRLNSPLDEGLRAKSLTRAWFENSDDKKEVQELLQKYQLDESALDAEAYRSVFSEIQEMNKTLAATEARFSKTIRGDPDRGQDEGTNVVMPRVVHTTRSRDEPPSQICLEAMLGCWMLIE